MSEHLNGEEIEALAADAKASSPHAAECAECKKAVRLARGRQKLLKGMRPYTLSDMAFSRVDARLAEHVRENPPGAWWGWRFVAGTLAAATVAMLLFFTWRPTPNERVPEAVLAAYEPMTVVHVEGPVALSAGSVLHRDARVDAEKGRVTLATADGESLRLEGGATLALGRSDAAVVLGGGQVAVDARRGGPWVVAWGPHFVRAVDATFDVAPDSLVLHRGSVLVSSDSAFRNARELKAPLRMKLSDGTVSALSGASPQLRPAVRPPWARLELKVDSLEVDLDGQRVGGAPLSLLTSPGKHRVRANVGGSWREADIELTASGPGLLELPDKVANVKPVGPVVEADPEAITAAIRAQLPKLRVCHEKWLKVDPSARGKVEMSLTVSPKGKVVKTSFTAAEGVPEAVNECLGRAARTMKLPASSEEVELQIPVVLGPAQ